jgi:hypothetical protein
MALFGTKTDLRDGNKKRSREELESQMQPIMDQFDVPPSLMSFYSPKWIIITLLGH